MSLSQFVPVRVLVPFLLVGFVLPGTAIAQNQPPDDDQDRPVEESDAEGDREERRSRRGRDQDQLGPVRELDV